MSFRRGRPTEGMAVYAPDGELLRIIVPTFAKELDDPAHSEGGAAVRVPIDMVRDIASPNVEVVQDILSKVHAEAAKRGINNARHK